MPTNPRTDPMRNFKFLVSINKPMADAAGSTLLARGGFMSVSGLSIQTEVIPYREGGYNTTTHKLPGQSDFPPIQLQRGMFANLGPAAGFWAWTKELFYYQQGQGPAAMGNNFRGDIVIRVLEHPLTRGGPIMEPQDNIAHGIAKIAFKVHNAWPTSMQISDLDAGGNAVMVEQVTLAHEGIQIAFAGSTSVLPEDPFPIT